MKPRQKHKMYKSALLGDTQQFELALLDIPACADNLCRHDIPDSDHLFRGLEAERALTSDLSAR
jgi:hypothetical protein